MQKWRCDYNKIKSKQEKSQVGRRAGNVAGSRSQFWMLVEWKPSARRRQTAENIKILCRHFYLPKHKNENEEKLKIFWDEKHFQGAIACGLKVFSKARMRDVTNLTAALPTIWKSNLIAIRK